MRTIAPILLLLTACATTPATDPVTDRLEHSPRHNECVQIARDARTVHAYVAYPEVSAKAPAIIVIHENRGLTDWERSVADKLAENGYIAIAPDMLSGMAPNGGRASDFPSQDAAREAIGKLPAAQVMADLNAAANYVKALPAASGTLSVGGFCWGGGRTWQVANQRQDLAAAYPFYGPPPQDSSGVAGIRAPVFAFYGGNDARINAMVPKAEELMREAGKRFEPVT